MSATGSQPARGFFLIAWLAAFLPGFSALFGDA
jgi:hypothetical protein